jgi:hypothetical protein
VEWFKVKALSSNPKFPHKMDIRYLKIKVGTNYVVMHHRTLLWAMMVTNAAAHPYSLGVWWVVPPTFVKNTL